MLSYLIFNVTLYYLLDLINLIELYIYIWSHLWCKVSLEEIGNPVQILDKAVSISYNGNTI